MPILRIHAIHSPSSVAKATAQCHSSIRSIFTLQNLAAQRFGGRIVADGVGLHLKNAAVRGFSVRWESIPSGGFGLRLRKGVEGGGSESSAEWCGLRSESGKHLQDSYEGRRLIDRRMAAPAVAKPAPFRLDTIPNGVPVALSASETLPADSKRHRPIIVVGHRGCGKNAALSIGDVPGTRLSVRENTIKSFNLAASNGADYTEFDVQVTKDGHPVIFHDDLILSADGQASRIGDLTLDEFLSFGPQKDGKAGKRLVRKQGDGVAKPWTSILEDSLCTLKEAFEFVQPSVGFNIELKFHDYEETPEHELRRVISATLADVEMYAKGRTIYFSSFHPDGAIMLRHEQNTYPVFMLTDGGENIYSDPRRNSVEAAIDVCVKNGLEGVVSEVLAILKKPQLATRVKDAGLSLFTYGDMNNVAEALVQQYNLNVDGVIVDCVREIVTASRTLHALLNFVQPDWSQFLQPPPRDVHVQ